MKNVQEIIKKVSVGYAGFLKRGWSKGKLFKIGVVFLVVIVWPLTLLALCWNMYHKFDKPIKSWLAVTGVLIITLPLTAGWIGGITDHTPSKTPSTSNTTLRNDCVGPDGKRIGLSPEACGKFNNAWRNKQQDNKQEAVTIPKNTVQPTKTITNTPTRTASTPTNTPAPQTDRASMLTILKTNASTKWGDNYQMVKYEYDNQVEAYDWVIAQTKYPDIMAGAKQKWGNNYQMVKYEYENQAEAYEWIMAQTAYPEIMAKAKQKWGTNYQMVKYEYDNQVEAYKSL